MSNKYNKITIENNEKYLRQISKIVNIKEDKELNDNIKVLDEFCKENDVMAMAAVQLGIPKRIVYLKNTNLDIINKMQKNESTIEEDNYNEQKVLINPKILKRKGLTEYWEACASCLDNCGRVLRPYKIELEYFDINNIKHIETFESFPATVLSHELDHLDGILHMDIAEEVLILNKEERKKLRVNNPYKIIYKYKDYDTLKQQYRGKNEKDKETK